MRRPTLLVIDDDGTLVAGLVRAASARGYDAIGVADLGAAVRHVRQWRPDVVLLDLRMPGVDGRDLLARLKSDPATAAAVVVVLTGMYDEHTRNLCLRYGAADFVRKPIDLDELFRRLDVALRPEP